VPVAELLPALVRSLGLLDAATVHVGYRLVTPVGRELNGEAGLVGQGVQDGDLLVLAVGIEQPAPRVYDDLAEATADVVERDVRPWDPASGRRVATVGAGLLLGLAAVALLTQLGSLRAAVTAVVAAVSLITGAVVLSRTRHEVVAAVMTAWLATAHAAVAGLLAADRAAPGLPVAAAGGGALLAGLTGLVGYEVLEGNGAIGFATPLATLHAFNGWADMFLTTPANGLKDLYFRASYALPADFIRIIGQIEAGAIDTQPWITHQADGATMIETFATWLRPETGVIKAMLVMPEA